LGLIVDPSIQPIDRYPFGCETLSLDSSESAHSPKVLTKLSKNSQRAFLQSNSNTHPSEWCWPSAHFLPDLQRLPLGPPGSPLPNQTLFVSTRVSSFWQFSASMSPMIEAMKGLDYNHPKLGTPPEHARGIPS
jgi:hypothetical protein